MAPITLVQSSETQRTPVSVQSLDVRTVQACVGIDNFTAPGFYDNINSAYGGSKITGGQTFTAVDDRFFGVRVLIGDPSRPSDPTVGPLTGPAYLVLYEVTDGAHPARLARSLVVPPHATISGDVTLLLRHWERTTPGKYYFWGIEAFTPSPNDAGDEWGIGLTGSASTYAGGAQAFINETDGTFTDLSVTGGRDVSFQIFSNCPE